MRRVTTSSDGDGAVQEEVRNAARTLLEGVEAQRSGMFVTAGKSSRSAAAKVDSHVLNLESAYIMSERTSLLAKTVH